MHWTQDLAFLSQGIHFACSVDGTGTELVYRSEPFIVQTYGTLILFYQLSASKMAVAESIS